MVGKRGRGPLTAHRDRGPNLASPALPPSHTSRAIFVLRGPSLWSHTTAYLHGVPRGGYAVVSGHLGWICHTGNLSPAEEHMHIYIPSYEDAEGATDSKRDSHSETFTVPRTHTHRDRQTDRQTEQAGTCPGIAEGVWTAFFPLPVRPFITKGSRIK